MWLGVVAQAGSWSRVWADLLAAGYSGHAVDTTQWCRKASRSSLGLVQSGVEETKQKRRGRQRQAGRGRGRERSSKDRDGSKIEPEEQAHD